MCFSLQLDIDELTVENAIGKKSLDQVIRIQLDPIWHQLVRPGLKEGSGSVIGGTVLSLLSAQGTYVSHFRWALTEMLNSKILLLTVKSCDRLP